MIKLLGIDNVLFEASNLKKAIEFYSNLGFKFKFYIPQINTALFAIGNEEPGLILVEKQNPSKSKLWIEVENAEFVKNQLEKIGVNVKMLETSRGLTVEINDTSENIIGFADYIKKPELSRTSRS